MFKNQLIDLNNKKLLIYLIILPLWLLFGFFIYKINYLIYLWLFLITLILLSEKQKFFKISILISIFLVLPTITALSAITKYFTGNAVLYGFSSSRLENDHEIYRTPATADWNCQGVDYAENFIDSINNFTIIFLIKTFGFQKDSYTGKYFPSRKNGLRDGLNELNKNGEIVNIYSNGNIVEIKFEDSEVPKDNLRFLIKNYKYFRRYSEFPKARMVVKNNEYIILQPLTEWDSTQFQSDSWIYYIDYKTGKPFARFVLTNKDYINLFVKPDRFKYGFIDKSGKKVIPQLFDEVSEFNKNDLAYVKIKKKWGFINKMGKFVISPQFDEIYQYNEELSGARINKKEGFINYSGEFVIPPIYDEVGKFISGVANVRIKKKWGFINKSGKFIIPPKYSEVYRNNKGLGALVCLNGKCGIVNNLGKYILEPKYKYEDKIFYSAWPCDCKCEEINCFYEPVKINGKFGIIDKKTRKPIIEPKFDTLQLSEDGLAKIKIKNKEGFINTKGQFLVKPEYDEVEMLFDNDHIFIFKQNNHWGLIDSNGKIINDNFDSIDYFYDYLKISKDKKIGVMDKSFKWVIEPQNIEVDCISEHLIKVKINKKWGFMDLNGKMVIKPEFENVSCFENGLASFQDYGKNKYIILKM